MKIAAALICKGDDQEALVLERALGNILPWVDAIYVTATHKKGEKPNQAVLNVCSATSAVVSHFEWVDDFAKARNFNFSQVPKEYDYILWMDADDVWEGLEKLSATIEENPLVDAFAFWYMYDFDEYHKCTVVHKKTQVIKNDGCVEWQGAIHEDFKENRSLNVKFVEGIKRVHLTSEERVESAKVRNVRVSLKAQKENPDDPRTYWNLANSYWGAGKIDKARKAYEKFIDMSQSEDEKYLAWSRLGLMYAELKNKENAIQCLRIAIGIKPHWPDAYFQLGEIYYKFENWEKAAYYLKYPLDICKNCHTIRMTPPYHELLVYNPRDYDYNPMIMLARTYFQMDRPDLALPMVKGCLAIHPEDEYLAKLAKTLEDETQKLYGALEAAKKIAAMTDIEEIKKELDNIDPRFRSHPAFSSIEHRIFIKKESSGKDITYFCGITEHEWNPDKFEKEGFGGSEEAVYYLSKEWAKKGYNVTVYNNCGTQPVTKDGVTYKPYWMFNPRDKTDYLILWRHPRSLDYEINCDNVYVDMHDVIPKGEFNEKRLAKVKKVFVKSKFHRDLYPQIPDEKIEIIPNGTDLSLFEDTEKDPYLIINTSSADRSMRAMPELFQRIKEKVPQAKMKWAYGWGVFNSAFEDNPKALDWRDSLETDMKASGIENLGKLNQAEVAKLYQKASVLLYPTEFAEIDCISVRKAQIANAYPITTDFAALETTNELGVKIHSPKTAENWSQPYQFDFAVTDEKMLDEFVEKTVDALKNPKNVSGGKDWGEQFSWGKTADKWINKL